MKVQLINNAASGVKLCAIDVTRAEAIALIQSLAHQLETGYCNSGRLESRCTGDANEMTIFVESLT